MGIEDYKGSKIVKSNSLKRDISINNPKKKETINTSNFTYVGEILNGKFNGKGTIRFKNGDSYTGDFVNDKFNGQGKFISKVYTYTYEGGFVDGKYNGQGKLISKEYTSCPEK